MTIDNAIRKFVEFLNCSWEVVSQSLHNRDYTTNENAINDWLQANWELLVERKVLKIGEYLEVYGEGADFNRASSRITDPEALPDFKIKVKSKTGVPIFDVLNEDTIELRNVTFERIVGFKDGFYVLELAFKYALLREESIDLERVVSLDEIEFDLEEL